MRKVVVIGVGAALAAAAAATVYVQEDFEGSFPPSGWTVEGRWSKEPSGPKGAYAEGIAQCGVGSARSDMLSYPFGVDASETIYYRFDFADFYAGNPSTWGADFYLVYADLPNEIIKQETMSATSDWTEYAGSVVAPRAGSVRAYWIVRVACTSTSASAEFDVDGVAIGDQPDIGVAPASLGRVKTLFR